VPTAYPGDVRRLLRPKWWLLHVFVVAAVLVMLRLGLWQWHRANSPTGGIQNYAYAFQWPLFACFAIFLWVRTMQEELRRPFAERGEPDHRPVMPEADIIRQPGVRVGIRTEPIQIDEDDAELVAWNARLNALNAKTASLRQRKA
jgi:DNA-binding transcriptional regulator of glucitol operon